MERVEDSYGSDGFIVILACKILNSRTSKKCDLDTIFETIEKKLLLRLLVNEDSLDATRDCYLRHPAKLALVVLNANP